MSYREEERDGQIITKVKPITTKTSIGTNNFYISKRGRKLLNEAGLTETEMNDITENAINEALQSRRSQAQQRTRPRGPDDDIYDFYGLSGFGF